jgi:peptidyl-prolyl cis-trans isomerase SurA
MRKLFLGAMAIAALAARAETVDRIAAVIDEQVLTVSEVGQLVELRFFERDAESDDEYRRDILEALIAQTLRLRDVERFGAPDVPADTIEARLVEIQRRFPSPADFEAALVRAELTLDEVRALIRRQLQVEIYIRERFAPLVFVSNEEIDAYYRGPWSQQRRQRGLAVVPLDQVREEVRESLRAARLEEEVARWTDRLRLRADVDIFAWR